MQKEREVNVVQWNDYSTETCGAVKVKCLEGERGETTLADEDEEVTRGS